MESLAKDLAKQVPCWDYIFTSPLTRCLQTTEAILEQIPTKSAPQVTDLLVERRGGGHICNQRKKTNRLQDLWPNWQFVLSEDRDRVNEAKETDETLEARMDFLMKIVNSLHGENILLVTHHDLIES